MNKNLIIKKDSMGEYIVCPYCDKPLADLSYYKAVLDMQEGFYLARGTLYLNNRYGAELKYCCNCGNKLNFKNLQKKLSKDNGNT